MLMWADDGILPCMPTLPDFGTLLVRTDFTDDDAWNLVRDEATREYGPDGFRAYVEPVSDPQWADATWEAVKAAAPVDDNGPSVLFIADSITFASPEHPIVVVDLDDKILSVAEFPEIAGRTPFRCIPSELWSVENNLNVSNMDWEEFAAEVGDDGVFRGFEEPEY
jgi:hypothetical protein